MREFFIQGISTAEALHHFLQEGRVDHNVIILCLRTIPKNHILGLGGIGGKHSPVDESSVSDIRVINLLSCNCEQVANQTFKVIRVLDIDLDG